jgi:hypothetical protein
MGNNMNNKIANNGLRHLRLITLLPVTALLLSGCLTAPKAPTTEAILPMAVQTTDLLGKTQFDMQMRDSILLYPYIKPGVNVASDKWWAQWTDLRLALRAVALYSVNIVDLAETSDKSRANELLAGYVTDLDSAIKALPSAAPFLPQYNINTVAREIREANSFSTAIKTAEPPVEELADTLRQMVLEADKSLSNAYGSIYDAIIARHHEIIAIQEVLSSRKDTILAELQLADRAWDGDDEAWNKLLTDNWELREIVGKPGKTKMTAETMGKVRQWLIDILGNLETIRVRIEPDYNAYRDEMQELFLAGEDANAILQTASFTIDAWDRARREFSGGEKSSFSKISAALLAVAYRKGIEILD